MRMRDVEGALVLVKDLEHVRLALRALGAEQTKDESVFFNLHYEERANRYNDLGHFEIQVPKGTIAAVLRQREVELQNALEVLGVDHAP